MVKILQRSHQFLISPAPGWRNITLLEISQILATPWTHTPPSAPSCTRPSLHIHNQTGNSSLSHPIFPSTTCSVIQTQASSMNIQSSSFPSLPHLSASSRALLSSSPSSILIKNCSYRLAMEISSRLLTGHDIEWVLLSQKCPNRASLAYQLKQFSLNDILTSEAMQSIKVVCYANKSFVNSSSLLKELYHLSHPVSSTQQGLINRLKISLIENHLTISLSFGGNDLPLFKRGYKFESIEMKDEVNAPSLDVPSSSRLAVAPLAEHHAAACFLFMLYSNCVSEQNTCELSIEGCVDSKRFNHLIKNIDRIVIPFAGSGTLGFEAILVAHGVGSGALKRKYAYHQFTCTPHKTMTFLQRYSSKTLSSSNSSIRVQFSDINPDTLIALRSNIISFQNSIIPEVSPSGDTTSSFFDPPMQIDFFQCSIEQLLQICITSQQKTIVLLLNPPYGLRLGKKTSQTVLYQKIANRILEIYDYLCSNRSISSTTSQSDVPILMGYCICSDHNTASLMMKSLEAKFQCRVTSFSHGGKERFVVSFISREKTN